MGARTQKKWGPEGWGPKISRFFSVSRSHFRSFCLSLGVFSWFFGGVWKRRGSQMFTFGVLGLSCEAPAAPKPPGFHTTTRGPKRAHFSFPGFKNTTKFHEKTPERREKNEMVTGEGKKKRNFGRRGVRRRVVQTNTTTPHEPQKQQHTTTQQTSRKHTTQNNTTTHTNNNPPNTNHTKFGLAKIGQTTNH